MTLINKIHSRTANVGIIGLGYVGLPLVVEFCKAGFQTFGFDVDQDKIDTLMLGKSYIRHIDSADIAQCGPRFVPTCDFSKLAEVDCILVCVPTPLNKNREPQMSYVFSTAKTIAQHLRKDQLVVLESTTYPGTTDEDMRAILEESQLVAGEDFFLAYSPEREDPNNRDFSTGTIPKVVGGYTDDCLAMAQALYDSIVVKTVPVSSARAAEATKLLENIFRAVNIALVNELKMLFERMDIDIWEVIEAAKTKPFGFQAFYPGPGLGGHCIPIDPFYLTWKAREYDFSTRFIELAGEINTQVPYYVVDRVGSVLNAYRVALKGARVLVLGMAYKKDIDDQRESPALRIIQLLKERGANVVYNDPYVSNCSGNRQYPDINLSSVELTADELGKADVTLLITDHSDYDYSLIEKSAKCIVDTRNAFRDHGITSPKVFHA